MNHPRDRCIGPESRSETGASGHLPELGASRLDTAQRVAAVPALHSPPPAQDDHGDCSSSPSPTSATSCCSPTFLLSYTFSLTENPFFDTHRSFLSMSSGAYLSSPLSPPRPSSRPSSRTSIRSGRSSSPIVTLQDESGGWQLQLFQFLCQLVGNMS